MSKIIAISGKRGSGKSLLAYHLTQLGYVKASLAAELKVRCIEDFGLTFDQINGTFKESPTQYIKANGRPYTPRDIMIEMGKFYRSVDPLFWCRRVDLEELAVIDDIRFMNELEYFKGLGTVFVRLERDPKLNIFKTELDDPSETELDTFKEWNFILPATQNRTSDDLKKFARLIHESV